MLKNAHRIPILFRLSDNRYVSLDPGLSLLFFFYSNFRAKHNFSLQPFIHYSCSNVGPGYWRLLAMYGTYHVKVPV